jgi:predicted dehydrogenase
MARIRWGILGTGLIAGRFADCLRLLPDAELVAVASRRLPAAHAFADAHGIPVRHGTYDLLMTDPRIDAVYVATPTTLHRDNTIRSLEAGKAVLCEKPFAVDAIEAAEMVACARRHGRLLMEAMWPRFVPAMRQVQHWLRTGAVGDVRMVMADFGFRAAAEDMPKWASRAVAGGALMFVGVYPVSLAAMAYGREPEEVAAMCDMSVPWADLQTGMLMRYAGGGIAVLAAAVSTKTPRFGAILGSAGAIRLDEPFYCSGAATLTVPGAPPQRCPFPVEGEGYHYQVAAFMASLRAGEQENPLMRLDESVSVMRTLDRLRAAIGLDFTASAPR